MSDILVKEFRVGHNGAGAAALSAWIASNVTAGANKLLAVKNYNRQGDLFALAVMATNTLAANTTVASGIWSADFEIQDAGVGPVAAFMNTAIAGYAAPATPTLSAPTTGGTLSAGTLYVKTSLVYAPQGETAASTEASQAVTLNGTLVVASPAAAALAVGWNVYVGTASGTEYKQNSTPLAFGTNFTLTAAATTSGATASAVNHTKALYLQALSFEESNDGQTVRILAVLSA
jgi:hypothetical protein